MEVVLRTHFGTLCAQEVGHEKIFIGARPQYANALWFYYSMARAQQTFIGHEINTFYFCELISPVRAYLLKNAEDIKAVFCTKTGEEYGQLLIPTAPIPQAEEWFTAAFVTKEAYIRMVQSITVENKWETAKQRWCQEWLVKPDDRQHIVVNTSKLNQRTLNQLLVPKKVPRLQMGPFVAKLRHKTGTRLLLVQRQAHKEVNLGNGLTLEYIACRNSNQAALKTAELIQAKHTLLSFSSTATGKLREGSGGGFDNCVRRLKESLCYQNHDDDAAKTHGLLANAPSFISDVAAALYSAIATEEFTTDGLPVDGYYHMVREVEKNAPLDASFFESL